MKKRRVPVERELGQRITIRLDPSCYAQLQDYASSEGFSTAVIVRHLVKRFLENQRKFRIDTLKGLSA